MRQKMRKESLNQGRDSGGNQNRPCRFLRVTAQGRSENLGSDLRLWVLEPAHLLSQLCHSQDVQHLAR